jgi:hypothetical protein
MPSHSRGLPACRPAEYPEHRVLVPANAAPCKRAISGQFVRPSRDSERHWQAQLHETLYLWSDKVDIKGRSWAEIYFNRLPRAGSITHRNVDADGVNLVHFSRLRLHAK